MAATASRILSSTNGTSKSRNFHLSVSTRNYIVTTDDRWQCSRRVNGRERPSAAGCFLERQLYGRSGWRCDRAASRPRRSAAGHRRVTQPPGNGTAAAPTLQPELEGNGLQRSRDYLWYWRLPITGFGTAAAGVMAAQGQRSRRRGLGPLSRGRTVLKAGVCVGESVHMLAPTPLQFR